MALAGTLLFLTTGSITLLVGGSRAGPATRPAAARTPRRSDQYGGLPSWLPKAEVRVGRIAHASAAHPWLAIQGDTVSVALAGRHLLVTTVGPQVPETGRFPVPRSTPCRFLITFTAASAPVPLNASAFTIADELGQLHHPRVTALGGGPAPALLRPRSTVTLAASDVLPTGNGQLRWAPATAKPIVSWDFDVEID